MGDMLEQSWEEYGTQLANAEGVEELKQVLYNIVAKQRIDLSQPATVIYGHDTRPSCQYLVRALAAGLSATPYSGTGKLKSTNYGEVTTPILHYLTRCLNTDGAYGPPTVEGYYNKLSNAFKKLVVSACPTRIKRCPHSRLGGSVRIICQVRRRSSVRRLRKRDRFSGGSGIRQAAGRNLGD